MVEGDSLGILEEYKSIRPRPLKKLSGLWSADGLKDAGRMFEELRKEWDDSLEKKAVHGYSSVPSAL